MEHLPLPATPSLGPPRVPFVCRKAYDCGDFLTYPHRVGWSKALPSAGEPPFGLVEHRDPSDDRDLERFLQNWIFFGLLYELLSANKLLRPHQLYRPQDYIEYGRAPPRRQSKSKSNIEDQKLRHRLHLWNRRTFRACWGRYVHTKGLVQRLVSWREIINTWSHEERLDLGRNLHACLTLIHKVLLCLFAGGHPGFHPNIKLSILAMCEVVSDLGDTYLKDSDGSPLWPMFNIWMPEQSMDQGDMLQQGWCPSEVTLMRNEYSSVAGTFYISRLQKPGFGIDHSGCDSAGCSQVQIDPATYRTRHTTEGCDCELIGPDPEQIAACLDQGGFPILEVVSDNQGGITVKTFPYSDGIVFVALSHVWVDGLGNPFTMELPCCQVQRLRALVSGLQGNIYKWNDNAEERAVETQLFLWCDTLCCPTITDANSDRQWSLKKKALDQLIHVYQNAAYVLVLDRSLEALPFANISALEAGIRLASSRWARRLWTFQEGALARKLLVQFSDKAVDLRDIRQTVLEIYRDGLLTHQFSQQIAMACGNLKTWFQMAPTSGPSLDMLTMAVRHRRVSVPSDEPLCLAAAMNLNLSEVTAAKPSERMERFWDLLSNSPVGLRSDIIFNKFPRLQSLGFRWAPCSLQAPPSDLPWNIVADNDNTLPPGKLTSLGLRVRRPGWQLRTIPCPLGLVKIQRKIHDWLGGISMIRTSDHKWFNSEYVTQLSDHSKTTLLGLIRHKRTRHQWNIVLTRAKNIPNSHHDGLLVAAEPIHPGEQTIHRSFATLGVFETHPSWEAIYQETHRFGMLLRKEYNDILFTASMILLYYNLSIRTPHSRGSRRILGLSLPFLRWLLVRIVRWMTLRLLQRRCTEASRTEKSAKAIKDLGAKPSVAGQVMLAFIGNFVEVIEEFPQSREWCVD